MHGIHDLGGMEGFGTIYRELNEPTFHEPWQSLAFRINTAAIGWLKAYNADEYRHAVERMDPVHYLTASYYERMLTGSITLLIEKGVVNLARLEELAAGEIPLANPVAPSAARPRLEQANQALTPGFETGQTVRVRPQQTAGHSRAPQYVHGCVGTVVHIAPPFSYPDHSAHGLPAQIEPTVHVAFRSKELWGEQASDNDEVIVDLWQSYLEPV